MHGTQPPNDPAEELEQELQLDAEQIQVRQWVEQQIVGAGVGAVTAMRLSYLPTVDYRRVAHLKELGMSDDAILDEYLD